MANTIGNNMEQINPSAEATKTEWDDLASAAPFQGDNEGVGVPAEAVADDVTTVDSPVTESDPASAAPVESKKLLVDMFYKPGEARPAELSEAERRKLADREGVNNALHMLSSALHQENLHPDDERKINLSLDVMDEVSAELDDEENDLGAHDILQKLAQRYDKLSQKAPSRERKLKYVTMAVYAQSQMSQFGDWKAIDAEKARPKTAAEKKFDELSQLM